MVVCVVYGLYYVFCIEWFQCFVQVVDVYVDGMFFNIYVVVLYVVEQLCVGIDLFGMGYEEVQQVVFGGVDWYWLVVGEYVVCCVVDMDGVDCYVVVFVIVVCMVYYCLDMCEQFVC